MLLSHSRVSFRPQWRGSVVGGAAGREMIDTAIARAGFVHRPIKSLCIGLLKKPDLSIPPAAVSLRSQNGATCFFLGKKACKKPFGC